MSEILDTTTEPQVDEVQELRTRLDMMGVKYHHNAKVETLRGLLQKALTGDSEPEEVKPAELSIADIRAKAMADATKLIRCRITCMNPHKREWQGEIFTAGNSFTGAIKKFVPYNCEHAESYHIPRILLDVMRERKYLQTRAIKTVSGATQESYFVPEFQIVELDPLTKDELEQLASDQRNQRGN